MQFTMSDFSNESPPPSIKSSSSSDTDSVPGNLTNAEVGQTFVWMQQSMDLLRGELAAHSTKIDQQQQKIEQLQYGLNECQSQNRLLTSSNRRDYHVN